MTTPPLAAIPSVGLVGVNGYGRTHLRDAARLQQEGVLRVAGYADVAPDAAAVVAEHLAARSYAARRLAVTAPHRPAGQRPPGHRGARHADRCTPR